MAQTCFQRPHSPSNHRGKRERCCEGDIGDDHCRAASSCHHILRWEWQNGHAGGGAVCQHEQPCLAGWLLTICLARRIGTEEAAAEMNQLVYLFSPTFLSNEQERSGVARPSRGVLHCESLERASEQALLTSAPSFYPSARSRQRRMMMASLPPSLPAPQPFHSIPFLPYHTPHTAGSIDLLLPSPPLSL